MLFTLCLIWAGDMLAYFVGRSLGHLPMAPALSPKKTWEGAIANVIASLLVAVLFARWMQADTMNLLVIAGLANVAGQMGDLIKSAYKRGAVVKDSGTLLPGHGGMLDRIDSLILAAPVVWVAWQFIARRSSSVGSAAGEQSRDGHEDHGADGRGREASPESPERRFRVS